MARIAVIGAGPAGLIAAECLAGFGHAVTIYDQMPSPGRKLLLAGRGGLNLTHSEPRAAFLARYAESESWLAPAITAFPPDALRAWCEGLGQPIFIGTSGRIFPQTFKAAPLLRAWLRRLDSLGVKFMPRHRWRGWAGQGDLNFLTPMGGVTITPDATLLALGGASWPRMGADGAWVHILRERGITTAELRPSNCGVRVDWSPVFRSRYEGTPLKRIAISVAGKTIRGDAIVTQTGLEGGAIYPLSPQIRIGLDAYGSTNLAIDLRPDIDQAALSLRVDGPRQGQSLSNFLRQQAGLAPVGIGLMQEALRGGHGAVALSRLIKALPIKVIDQQPIDRAISSAGGIVADELNESYMIKHMPGTFAAGEMLNWEAPTGGYLLQACFSTGARAAKGIADWLGM